DTLMLMREDLLRRSGRFGQLIEEYSGITFGDPMLDAINAFQIEKAKEGDTGCYTVRDAVPAEEEDDSDDGHGEHDSHYIDPDDYDDYEFSDDEDLPEWLSMWIDVLYNDTAEFDHEYLQQLGISFERVEEETKFLGCLNEDLQVRTGEKVSEGMPEELLEEFDSISDPYEVMSFLEEHCPDYKSITMRCIWEISCELIRYIDRIPGADTAGKPPVMDEDISLLELDERILSRLRTMGIDTVEDIVMTDLSGHEELSSDDTDRIAVSVMKLLMSDWQDNDAV
ncbi:MAG: hypothetical protein IIZ17_01405, partial [Eubacteriaceae bacterium]|nr:hypothetical protein [Eubacteriaceae bacterium]